MLSALIHYPGHALSQLECRICLLGVARRLCRHCRVYNLALQWMFFCKNSSVLFYCDLVLVAGKIIIWMLMVCARLIARDMTQIQSLLDVTLLLDCLNLWRMKVLWFHVQVWRDLLSSLIISVCLLPVLIIISGTWLRWKKMSSQMLQSPSCLVGYLKPHSHFKPSCTHFTQQKFARDGMMGIWSLRSLCWWGGSGKYEAPVTAFAGRGAFEYLLPLSRARLSPPVAMHFLTLTPVSRDMTTY